MCTNLPIRLWFQLILARKILVKVFNSPLPLHSFVFIYQFSFGWKSPGNFLPHNVTMKLVKFFAPISQLLSNLSSPSNIKKWQNRQNLKPDIFDYMLLIHFMRKDWHITSFPYTGILRMYELLLKILSRDIHSLYLSGYHRISLWISKETETQNLSISRFH